VGSLLHNLLVFGRVLRQRGMQVHIGRLLDVVEALQHVDIGSRDEVFHTCRALLVHRHDDLAVFDRAFDAFWRSLTASGGPAPQPADQTDAGVSVAGPPSIGVGETDESAPTLDSIRTWSDAARLADKDFGVFSAEEAALAGAALDRLAWSPGVRTTRRWAAGRGARVDLRRALARSLRTGGDIVVLPRRRRRTRTRPIVLLCDVSGSMERYSRMLVHFAHALAKRHGRVEAFLFSTRLTRITRQLRTPRLDAAVAAVSQAVPDWSGGTRIGESIRAFHQQWGRRAARGGPVVLLISDGWDRGDPQALALQVARLQRSCHRLIWLNPLIGTAGYEPLTRGLQAALPFVDDFLPARTLNNLRELAEHLGRLETR
jgi:uncharacterized protein